MAEAEAGFEQPSGLEAEPFKGGLDGPDDRSGGAVGIEGRSAGGAGSGSGAGAGSGGKGGPMNSAPTTSPSFSSSCPGESFSLDEPKTRRTSNATFSRRSSFSRCIALSAENAASSWRVSSASRGVIGDTANWSRCRANPASEKLLYPI